MITKETASPGSDRLELWHELAEQLRVDSIRSTSAAGSGHPTSAMSAADLMAVLLTSYFRFDFNKPHDAANDRFILSKGHAAPLLYAMMKAAGVISDAELLSLRRFGSPLQGHPVPIVPWIDVATGSLGQGLPIGVGMALAGKFLAKLPFRVWVLLGDSETAEGSVWEAFEHAGHLGLSNITAILDVNRLGQRGQTMLGWDTAAYAARARAFGWHAIEIDGHDLQQIDRAYAHAGEKKDRPTAIVARTEKGKGVSFVENADGWHGKALNAEQAKEAIAQLGGERSLGIAVRRPAAHASNPPDKGHAQALELPRYADGSMVATRKAYGDALKALGAARPDVVALDGEVSNSTYADEFAKAFPDRYFEMYIAEQQLVAAAVGLQVLGYKPFASTFAAFLSRAYDFVRMAAASRANIKLIGSHVGVSIGQDGPSQMGLEDIAFFRAVWGSTVLYPCDARQAAELTQAMLEREGIVYLRTTREATPLIYGADETFPIGGSKAVRRSAHDDAAIIAAGITVHEALEAYERLKADGIAVRVIDAYSVKPFDVEAVRLAAADTDGKLVVVEDHWAEGGLGAAVLDAFAQEAGRADCEARPLRLVKLAVRDMPGSGTPEELMRAAGIDADAIVAAVKTLVRRPAGAGA
jgi:transketolase